MEGGGVGFRFWSGLRLLRGRIDFPFDLAQELRQLVA